MAQSKLARHLDLDEAFALGVPLLEGLHQAQALYARQMDALLRSHGLTTGTWLLLAELKDAGCCPLSGLASRMSVHLSTLTKTVQRLEQGGWVHRSRPPGDLRVSLLQLTAWGGERLDAVNGALSGPLAPGAVGLSPAQWGQVAPLLATLVHPRRRPRVSL